MHVQFEVNEIVSYVTSTNYLNFGRFIGSFIDEDSGKMRVNLTTLSGTRVAPTADRVGKIDNRFIDLKAVLGGQS